MQMKKEKYEFEHLVESHLLRFQKAWNVCELGPAARWRPKSREKRRKEVTTVQSAKDTLENSTEC